MKDEKPHFTKEYYDLKRDTQVLEKISFLFFLISTSLIYAGIFSLHHDNFLYFSILCIIGTLALYKTIKIMIRITSNKIRLEKLKSKIQKF